MWNSLKDILTSANGVPLVVIIVLLVVLVIRMAVKLGKAGLLSVHTKHVHIGKSVSERELIRRQIECAHDFIMSIEGKIVTDNTRYNRYFTKYILERCYDKVVEWITFNHLNTKNAYIEIKQEEICSLVYGLGVKEEFKTAEFKHRMQNWTQELIEHLVKIREVYK